MTITPGDPTAHRFFKRLGITVTVIWLVLLLLSLLINGYQVLAQPDEFSSQTIDQYLQEQLTANHIPGMAVSIVSGNEIIYLKGLGTASLQTNTTVTPQTIFDLASCSKSFTAMAVLLLWHDGSIDLDQPFINYVPEFQLADAEASSEITVRQLLNQTSGLPSVFSEPLAYYSGSDAMQQLVTAMAKIHLDRTPGSSFEYTNLNYCLLGALIERVSDQPFEDFIQERIFDPLGMKNSTLYPEIAESLERADGHQLLLGKVITRNVPIYRSMIPAGWVMSSAEDMSRWLIVNLNDGIIDSQQVIPAEVIRAMHTTEITFTKDGDNTGYGMGWFTGLTEDNMAVIWHGGDTPNFLTEMILLPDQKLGIVMLINGQTCPHGHDIALSVVSLILGTDFNLPSSPWWASWKSIDNIAIYATIIAGLLMLGLIPYLWSQWRILNHYRRQNGIARRQAIRKTKIWRIVLPLAPWVLVAAIVVAGFIVVEMLLGFNIFRTITRFGTFAPPGILVAAIVILVAIFLWAIILSVTAILRALVKTGLQTKSTKVSATH